MKRRLVIGAALGLTTSLAIAAPAPAASWLDPGDRTYVPVPAGQVDHYVYEYDIQVTGEPRTTTRWETWVSADRHHSVSTSNGKLLTEDAVEGADWSVFYADANEIRIRTLKTPGRPPVHTIRTQAAINREQVQAGWLKVDGETTVDGRRALILVDGPKDPDAHHNSERMVVDAQSYVELSAERIANGVRDSDGSAVTANSKRTLVLHETVALDDAQAANLRMGDHPGARIVRAGSVEEEAFSAKNRKKTKKAKKRKRAKAKKRAGRSRRAAG